MGRPRVVLFAGPSVPPADLRAACAAVEAEVEVRPPAEQGDILRLAGDLPAVIAVLDGVAGDVPAVLHKEILYALEQGTRVLGAAGLGALRAAELDAFGMEGVGAVYRGYKCGRLAAEDEIAVRYAGPAGDYQPRSTALVNIRHNLARARARRVIAGATAAALLARARRLPFAARTWDAILDAPDGGVPPGELAALRRFLRAEAVDLMRADGLALVEVLADRCRGVAAWPTAPAVRVNRTRPLTLHERAYRGHTVGGRWVPEARVLAFEKLLSPSWPRLWRRVALRCLAVEEAGARGLVSDAPEALLAGFWQARGLASEEARAAWLRAHHLSGAELGDALAERDLEARLLAHYRAEGPPAGRAALYRRVADDVAARLGVPVAALTRPLQMRPGLPWDGPLLRELKLRGRFGAALARAGRLLAALDRLSDADRAYLLARLPPPLLERTFAGRRPEGTRCADTPFAEALLDRGFADYGEFLETAGLAYLAERAVPVSGRRRHRPDTAYHPARLPVNFAMPGAAGEPPARCR